VAQVAGEDIPSFFHVVREGLGLVLRKNDNFIQLRVDAITQRNIDKPVNPPERHSRFGSVLCERHQSLTPSSGHYDREYIFHFHPFERKILKELEW
jgi:hypothetical protein